MQYNQITTKIIVAQIIFDCVFFYINQIDDCILFCYFYSDIFKSNNILDNFQQLLDNVFLPLFEATNDPNTHPDLHR